MFTYVETTGADVHLRLFGPLDGANARELHGSVAHVADAPCGDLLLDLAAVDFIDVDGFVALTYLAKRLASRRRRLRLIGVSERLLAPLRDRGLADPVGPAQDFMRHKAAPRRRRPGAEP